MRTRRRNAELVEAAIIVLFSAIFYAMTWEFSDPLVAIDAALTPATVPRIILGLMLAFGIGRGVVALRIPADETITLPFDRVVLYTMVLSLAYAVAARYLGVFIPMPFYCVALAWLWGGRSIAVLAGIAIGVPLAIWLMFGLLFGSQLPLGPFFSRY